MKNEINENKIIIFTKNLLLSLILSIIMILVLSIIISVTEINEEVIFPSVIFISTLCIMIGSFFITKKIKEKGILYGTLFGFLYMLILFLISSIVNWDFSINLNSIIMIMFGIVGGAISGIMGVNL